NASKEFPISFQRSLQRGYCTRPGLKANAQVQEVWRKYDLHDFPQAVGTCQRCTCTCRVWMGTAKMVTEGIQCRQSHKGSHRDLQRVHKTHAFDT
ncbi:hypothetical protein HispidOSU_017529, partial [Sigmodon hispidus]